MNLSGTDHFGDLSVHRKIILKWAIKKFGERCGLD
jgi:hypothetical protein